MSERPILFSGPMVRAILAGQKTVTRRVVTPQPHGDGRWSHIVASTDAKKCGLWYLSVPDPSGVRFTDRGRERELACVRCPYGVPGNTLWVRETWASPSKHTVAYDSDATCGAYLSDGGGNFVWMPHGYIVESEREHGHHNRIGRRFGLKAYGGRWRTSIHMPRWASRITLRVEGVRVERLHAINDEDALREGVCVLDGVAGTTTPRERFAELWDEINGKRAPWESNPWVWRVAFSVVEVKR